MTTSSNDLKNNSTTFMLSPKKDAKSLGAYYVGESKKSINHEKKLALPSSRVLVPVGGVLVAIIALAGVEGAYEKVALNGYETSELANISSLSTLGTVGSYGVDLIRDSSDLVASGVHKLDSLLLLSAENNVKQTSQVSQTVFLDVVGVAEYYIDYTYAWWKAFKTWALEYISDILDKWKDFIYGVPSYSALDESALREQIRLELLKELGQGDNEGGSDSDGSSEEPYITQEPEGENTDLASIEDRVRRMFSDPVDVTFDEATQTGLITPRFRNDRGGEYVFLLAPLN